MTDFSEEYDSCGGCGDIETPHIAESKVFDVLKNTMITDSDHRSAIHDGNHLGITEENLTENVPTIMQEKFSETLAEFKLFDDKDLDLDLETSKLVVDSASLSAYVMKLKAQGLAEKGLDKPPAEPIVNAWGDLKNLTNTEEKWSVFAFTANAIRESDNNDCSSSAKLYNSVVTDNVYELALKEPSAARYYTILTYPWGHSTDFELMGLYQLSMEYGDAREVHATLTSFLCFASEPDYFIHEEFELSPKEYAKKLLFQIDSISGRNFDESKGSNLLFGKEIGGKSIDKLVTQVKSELNKIAYQ